jgi:hypothetical protein
MRCSQAHLLLQLYIDNQNDNQSNRYMTLQQIRMLETHLVDCALCREDALYLQTISRSLDTMEMVAEPADLTEHVMQRIAQSSQIVSPQVERAASPGQIPLRLSLGEMISAIVMATFTMTLIIFTQPGMRAMLPIANGHDSLSLLFINSWHMLLRVDSHTLLTATWIVGTILGIWITLLVAGSDMRNQWFKAVLNRLPAR